jgi:hypothetical protein
VGNGPFGMNEVGWLGNFWRPDPDKILGLGKVAVFI